MLSRHKLFRLLRDDEKPMTHGIVAKSPLADDIPLQHVLYGSWRHSQWISTSRNLSSIGHFIKQKRRHRHTRRCRVVEIDELKLVAFSKMCRLKIKRLLWKYNRYHTLPAYLKSEIFLYLRQTTGKIVDLTDPSFMNIYLHHQNRRRSKIARTYARKLREVLVERYIPAYCCNGIYYI